MKDPVDHIVRPTVPWRDPDLTQCGRSVADVAKVVSLDEARRRWRDQGEARASFTLCMTCVQTADRHRVDWDSNPIGIVSREATALDYVWQSRGRREDHDQDLAQATRLTHELRAIAMLIDAHRDEFEAAVAGQSEVTDLGKIRADRDAARAYSGGLR